MKNFLLALFGENGSASMTRLVTFIICITACYIAVTKGEPEVGIVTTLLTTALTGKVVQKFAEKKDKE